MTNGKALIIAARRTAIGRAGGLHRARPIEALAAPVMKAVLADAGLEGGEIDDVILGNAAGGGGNPARLAALTAGLPDSVPALSVDRQCASGLDAILTGARLIETGAAEAVIAGGAESPSTAPWRVTKPPSLYRGLPQFFAQPAFAPSAAGDPGMAESAEAIARDLAIPRAAQDEYALSSHEKAREATKAGRFLAEIVALGESEDEAQDEGVRKRLTAKLLARMPPLFPPDGTVTAGNACQINDGAACALLVSPELHRRLGSPPALRVIGGASAGIRPLHLGLGAAPAVRKLLSRHPAITLSQIGAIEFNEAFASQVIATLIALSLPPEIVNTDGGALALGHPYGASGAVLVTRLFSRMVRAQQRPSGGRQFGLAMIAAAGGLGAAALFEAI